MKTVKEVSTLTGVSVRTLHHYDAIGLLKPTSVTEAGYRLYDDAALRRLQTILMYRELEFPLREIRKMLDSPDFRPADALAQQLRLLELKKEHIEKLIQLARTIQEQGGTTMSFEAFDTTRLEAEKKEARERWGHTEAFREYAARNPSDDAGTALMELFAEFGTLRHLSPGDAAPQAKVRALQSFITENFYTCTREILAGLGQMYVADERFRRNIDRKGGEGTAEFVGRAIAVYCRE